MDGVYIKTTGYLEYCSIFMEMNLFYVKIPQT